MKNIKFDGVFDIALGRSRRETHWRNREMRWSELLSKLEKTHRTAESYNEYLAAKKDRRAEIKDVGGFVGGYINGGRRKNSNITHRQLLTLDVDNLTANDDIWGEYALIFHYAAAVYSTHRHSAEHPRLRLIIPLDRPVGADEYSAIARRIAANLGINFFDDTTYEPVRLMYWPSSSKDADYVFDYIDGPWLSASEILGTYKNWRDSSEWPVSDRAGEIVKHEIKKQGDPLEKPGLIGAFCRTHTIYEAIAEYLQDIYVQCDIEGRYTYKEGSTSAGLVVYDDTYSYSHHGTDPAGGALCNAFDLVRLHKFAKLDEHAKEGTPVNKLPSFVAMSELAAADKGVRRTINRERSERLAEEFNEGFIATDIPEQSKGWADELAVDKKGVLKGTIGNYEIILRGDPAIKGAFKYNEFRNTLEVSGSLPWRTKNDRSQWKDADDAGLRSYIEKRYETLSRNNLIDALSNIYEENRYHPVRDYLTALNWDKSERVDRLFVDYLGAEDTEYTRAITRKSLAAAVARIFKPGTKFDNVIVLIGEQGVGKSTILKKLGGSWFSDNFHAVQGKDAIEQIQGVWIMEIGELAGLKKAEVEAIKSYISTLEDRCRLAYARRVESFPRQCVFFGTTNKRDFLTDPTGNRRFWPIMVGESAPIKNLFTELTEYEVGQVWAETVVLYKQKELLYLPKELEEMANKTQTSHCEQDERAGIIEAFLDTQLPEKWSSMTTYERRNYLADDSTPKVGVPRSRVCIAEIWCECFDGRIKDLDRKVSMALSNIVRKIGGWSESKAPVFIAGYGRQRIFRRDEKKR